MRYNNTCQDPFDFIHNLKKRYRKGLTLPSPDLTDRALSAEDLLNWDIDLGECDNPIVLALVASRDPMVTMSMAATARFSPMTTDHRLLSGVFSIIGDVTRHEDVKSCVHVLEKEKFKPSGVYELRQVVTQKIISKRHFYRQRIKDNLQYLIDGKVAPETFVDEFFQGMGQLNLKHKAYTKMVVDFLLSKRFRPKVKILMIENLFKMPRDVRMQVVVDLCDAPKVGHNEAIRDELLCLLQDMPDLLNAPAANINSYTQEYAQGFLQRYPRSFKQKNEDMKDQAFMTAESVL